MNKISTFVMAAAMAVASVATGHAADQDQVKPLDHLTVGVNVGTPGIGLDVAMPLSNVLQLRAGVTYMPEIPYNTSFRTAGRTIQGVDLEVAPEVDIKAHTGFWNGKLLLDVYPLANKNFFFTGGFYVGGDRVIKARNKEDGVLIDIYNYNKWVPEDQRIGLALGDYLLTPDEEGNVHAYVKTWAVKPYLGLGYGKPLPSGKVGFQVELGAMFWGRPNIYCNGTDIDETTIDGKGGGLARTVSNMRVYPVLNFRITGKIF